MIDDAQLEQFKQLASQYDMLETIDMPLSLNQVDNWPAILNTWCGFNEQRLSLIVDSTKLMAHACDFYGRDLLRQSQPLKLYLQTIANNDEALYLLSYYVGREMLVWSYMLLATSDEGKAIITRNYSLNYFLAISENSNLPNDPTHPRYKNQKIAVTLMAQNHQTSPAFENHVQRAIQLTKQHIALLHTYK